MPEQNLTMPAQDTLQATGVERRAWVRYSLRKLTFCHAIAAQAYDRWWRATVHDVSVSGIGLTCNRSIPAGTLLAIELEGVARLLLARVVHATPDSEEHSNLGCEFLSKLSDEELQTVLSTGARPVPLAR